MEEKLKECPFCGKAAKVIYMGPEVTKCEDRWWVECKSCHAHAKRQFSKEEAIKVWNMRYNNN